MGSIFGHRIDYNGAGVLRGQRHISNPAKTNPSNQPGITDRIGLARFTIFYAHRNKVSILHFSDPAYGITIDYVYDTLGVTHSYTIELRPSDGDDNGFILPACQITDSGKEIMAAFKAISPIMAENPKRKVKRDRKLRSQ